MRQHSPAMVCPICQTAMIVKTSAFTHFCKQCDYWGAMLPVDIDGATDDEAEGAISDQAYIASLEGLRVKNFKLILAQLKQLKFETQISILDVGCASGLFMRVAQAQGYAVKGIEPNRQLFALTQQQGLNVVHDYFPPQQPLHEKFDVIIFNDVFEHIPDVHQILKNCGTYLKQDGLLILNLPNAEGLIFKVSRLLTACGWSGPWERLWQVMFRTPHLHYFTFKSLNKLLAQHRFFAVGDKHQIATIELTGFWARLALDRSLLGFLKNCVLYLGTLCLYPAIRLAEKDTFFALYRRDNVSDRQ